MINENFDSDVQKDMEMGLNKIVPEDFPYIHTAEGSDDMVRGQYVKDKTKSNIVQPGHLKSGIVGVSLNIPITDGKLNLGTWQG